MDTIKVDPVPSNLEPVKQITSEQFTWNWRDLSRGAIMAVITSVLATVQQALMSGGLDAIKWKEVVLPAAILAFISYMGLQFGSATKTIRVYKKA